MTPASDIKRFCQKMSCQNPLRQQYCYLVRDMVEDTQYHVSVETVTAICPACFKKEKEDTTK